MSQIPIIYICYTYVINRNIQMKIYFTSVINRNVQMKIYSWTLKMCSLHSHNMEVNQQVFISTVILMLVL